MLKLKIRETHYVAHEGRFLGKGYKCEQGVRSLSLPVINAEKGIYFNSKMAFSGLKTIVFKPLPRLKNVIPLKRVERILSDKPKQFFTLS